MKEFSVRRAEAERFCQTFQLESFGTEGVQYSIIHRDQVNYF